MEHLDTPEFLTLKAEVEAYARRHGYYLIRFADITALRESGASQEEIAETIFQNFDDQEWPPLERRPTDQSWADYTVAADVAREHTVKALMGGPEVGHVSFTLSRKTAERFYDRFDALLDEPKAYYRGLGLGDSRYVYQSGVAIIGLNRAGMLGIIEGD